MDLSLPTSLTGLASAFLFGTLIGAERQWRQRSAGLRTVVLVALGAAAFSDLGIQLTGPEGAARIVSYIISGIGFLGAGVILKDGTNIRGLNTAGTLWCAAAVGSFCGCGYALEAGLLTLFVLAGNTLLRPLVDYINRRPVTAGTTEGQYTIYVTCLTENAPDVRELLFDRLAAAHYPAHDVAVLTDTDDIVELGATLLATSAERQELDEVVAALESSPMVKSAGWTVGTVT